MGKGPNTQNIQMHVVSPAYWEIKGEVTSPANYVYLILYGETADNQKLKEQLTVPITQAGGDSYRFFVPDGDFNLLAWAGGCKGLLEEGLSIRESRELDIHLRPRQEPSVSIVSKQESLKQLRLNFRYNTPCGEAADWDADNKIEITFFAPEDAPDKPSGQTIQLIDPDNVGKADVFCERYLTYLIDADRDFMRYFVQNDVSTYQVVIRIRLIDGLGEDVIDPLIQKFEVKELPASQEPLSQIRNFFNPKEPSSVNCVSIVSKLQVGNQNIEIKSQFNAVTIDPTLLARVKKTELNFIDQDEQLTLQIEMKQKLDDQNCIAVDIKFTDSSGNIVEYNPPDPVTGQRDEEAEPIVFDLPLHFDLQGKGYTPQEAGTYVACNPYTDFRQVMEQWETVPEKYGIYFQTARNVELFIPGEGEGIEIVASETGLLMARVMVKHTSSWFMKSPKPAASSEPNKVVYHGKGCFISILKLSCLSLYPSPNLNSACWSPMLYNVK